MRPFHAEQRYRLAPPLRTFQRHVYPSFRLVGGTNLHSASECILSLWEVLTNKNRCILINQATGYPQSQHQLQGAAAAIPFAEIAEHAVSFSRLVVVSLLHFQGHPHCREYYVLVVAIVSEGRTEDHKLCVLRVPAIVSWGHWPSEPIGMKRHCLSAPSFSFLVIVSQRL